MGATFSFGLIVLCYHLLAVHGLVQKVNRRDVHVQQGTNWQKGQGEIMKTKGFFAPQQKWPAVGLKRRQESTFSLDQGLSDTKEDTPNALPIDITEANTITTNTENCQPLPAGGRLRARGGKEEQACPPPATTDKDTPESGEQQQPPTTGNEGDKQEERQAPGGTKQEQPLVLPNLLRIPMNDGDNPTCYDATHGLMPVGVCQNPQLTPQPSKYDVFMNRNIDIYPRAWKLIDSQPGASPLFLSRFLLHTRDFSIPLAHDSNLTCVYFSSLARHARMPPQPQRQWYLVL